MKGQGGGRGIFDRNVGGVGVARERDSSLSHPVLFLHGAWDACERPRGTVSGGGRDCGFCRDGARVAPHHKNTLAARHPTVLRCSSALVHRSADAQPAILPRIYFAAQSRALLQRSLPPSAAFLVLPARYCIGARSVDGIRGPGVHSTTASLVERAQVSFDRTRSESPVRRICLLLAGRADRVFLHLAIEASGIYSSRNSGRRRFARRLSAPASRT